MSNPPSYQPRVRLYVAADLAAGVEVASSPAQAHYLKDVMRLGAGAVIELFNGRDGAWAARIVGFAKKQAQLCPESQVAPQEQPPDLWLCFAPIKRDRIDYLVEKATELGVARLQPVLTARTQAARLNLDRLSAHIVEAAEQCGRTHVPVIAEPVKFSALLDHWPDDRQILFCDEMRDGDAAQAQLRARGRGRWAIFTGPEGGWSPDERAQLLGHPLAVAVHLGPRILRADTAALSAIALWQAVLGDW